MVLRRVVRLYDIVLCSCNKSVNELVNIKNIEKTCFQIYSCKKAADFGKQYGKDIKSEIGAI